MKKNTLITMLVAFILLTATSLVYAEKLTIATEGAWPPFNEKNAAGELVGFDVDIAKALCDEIGATCDIIAQDWDGLIPGLLGSKYDAIVASMSITDERKKSIDFSEKYYASYIVIIAKDGSSIRQNSDISGKSIGSQRATISATWLEDNYGRKSDIKLYDTQTAADSDLKAGRIDAIVTDIYPGYDWVKNNKGYGFVGKTIDINDEIGIGLKKGNDDLRNRLNKAIKTIRSNGVYAKINAKYFPFDIY